MIFTPNKNCITILACRDDLLVMANKNARNHLKIQKDTSVSREKGEMQAIVLFLSCGVTTENYCTSSALSLQSLRQCSACHQLKCSIESKNVHKILYTVAQLDYLTIIEEILVQGIKVIASLLKFLFSLLVWSVKLESHGTPLPL